MAAGRLDTARVADLLLLRLLSAGPDGATVGQCLNDLNDFVTHRLSQGEWRSQCDQLLKELISQGLAKKAGKSRFAATGKGRKALEKRFHLAAAPDLDWTILCDTVLVAEALGIEAKSLKALLSADRLRAAILKTHLHLPIAREIPTVAEVRTALAVRAMEKSFDQTLSKKFSAKTKLPEKVAVFLGSRLMRRPREIQSTAELFAWLAADALGAAQRDPKSLRTALIRSLIEVPSKEDGEKANGTTNDKPDDLQGFAHTINDLAKPHATGWPGNKRAYISHVWKGLQSERPGWGIDEDQFKSLLAEAHRAGHLTLQIADLRTKENIQDIQASVTKYKNNEWHLIRVDD